ncbi:1021_t:CDS:2, partial [Entrophospora sp. SA101]
NLRSETMGSTDLSQPGIGHIFESVNNDIKNNAIHGFSSDKPFNIQIPELSLEVILTESNNDIKNNAIHGFSSDKPFNIQIPELSLEVILTESSR